MAFTLDVSCKAYEDGPVIPVLIENVPVDEHEAIKMGLGRVMYDGYIRSLSISKQANARAKYKKPTSTTRTKRGSAVDQAAAARIKAMREASDQANAEAALAEDLAVAS